MNKLWPILFSSLLASCQIIRGNVPETRDLSRIPASVEDEIAIEDSRTEALTREEHEKREAQVNNDVQQLLQGRYKAMFESENPRVESQGCSIRHLSFEGSLIQLREQDFFANDCEGRVRGEVRIVGRIRVGPLNPVDAMKRDLDIEVLRVEADATANSWGLTAKQMPNDTCGILGMKSGETRNIAGQDCGSFGRYPRVGETYFTAISVNSSQTIGLPFIPIDKQIDFGSPSARRVEASETYGREDSQIQ